MDLSILITIVLGFATCISPSLVSLVNNHHTRKLRQLELLEAQAIKKLELNNELKKQLISEEYSYKRNIYTNFVKIATEYISDNRRTELYNQLFISYSECIISDIYRSHLDGFMEYAERTKGQPSLDENSLEQMLVLLKLIITDFGKNLKSISSGEQFDKTLK